MSKLKELELELISLEDVPENKKRRTVLKRKITLEKKNAPKVKIPPEVIIDVLEDFFSEDEEINIDEIIDNAFDEIPEEEAPEDDIVSYEDLREIEADVFIEKAPDDLKSFLEFFKEIYMIHPEIIDSFYHFSMKFRYFLIAENLFVESINDKKIGKFLRLYPNMDIVIISKFFGLDV